MATGHEEVQDKHLVFQDIKDMLKIATGHEEDVAWEFFCDFMIVCDFS